MSKRYTDTGKWIDPWFMELPPNSKLLFEYLRDNCNNAGFWEENPRMACFQIGFDERAYQGALKGLARGIKGASGWLWVKNFLRHQNNQALNPQNNAHKQIISQIRDQIGRFNGMPEFQKFIAPYEALLRGTGNGTGKGNEEVMNRKETGTGSTNVHDASAEFRKPVEDEW